MGKVGKIQEDKWQSYGGRPNRPIVSLESYLHSTTISQGYIQGLIFRNTCKARAGQALKALNTILRRNNICNSSVKSLDPEKCLRISTWLYAFRSSKWFWEMFSEMSECRNVVSVFFIQGFWRLDGGCIGLVIEDASAGNLINILKQSLEIVRCPMAWLGRIVGTHTHKHSFTEIYKKLAVWRVGGSRAPTSS